jgi:hypothetical protein
MKNGRKNDRYNDRHLDIDSERPDDKSWKVIVLLLFLLPVNAKFLAAYVRHRRKERRKMLRQMMKKRKKEE